MGNEKTPPYKNLSLNDMKGEVWKDITDFEGYYQVSNMGRVKSLERDIGYKKPTRILKQYKNTNKINKNISLVVYFTVNKVRTNYTVSRLVAEQILNLNIINNAVMRINCNPLDNRADNLYIKAMSDVVHQSKKTQRSKYKGVLSYHIMSFYYEGKEIQEYFETELEAAKKYDYYVKKYKLNRELNFPDEK